MKGLFLRIYPHKPLSIEKFIGFFLSHPYYQSISLSIKIMTASAYHLLRIFPSHWHHTSCILFQPEKALDSFVCYDKCLYIQLLSTWNYIAMVNPRQCTIPLPSNNFIYGIDMRSFRFSIHGRRALNCHVEALTWHCSDNSVEWPLREEGDATWRRDLHET